MMQIRSVFTNRAGFIAATATFLFVALAVMPASGPTVGVLFDPALEGGVPELAIFPRPGTGHPVPVWVRGLDFLSDRPEVDPQRIAVEGGSQGGAFALVLAGLDPRVAAAVANVPYISNIPDYIRLSTGGSGASFLERIKDPETGEAAARSLAYIDVANLAYSISAPTQIIVGVQDRVTPPLNGVVAYNRIPDGVPAELLREFTAGHEISPFMRESNRRWYETHLK
ncbi:MAG: hypothetical protein EA363_02395 [Balneolaceae bacterium]|nr:MAG: hypothetical protein EA363_02395 [Balneolaceae bacterium]